MDNNSQEYREILWKAMIFCLPSTSETGSLSILEWMSCEAAIITSDMGACPEMAQDIWFTVDPSIGSIKQHLEYLIKNKEKCNEFWKKARIKAVNNYDKSRILQNYIKVCEKYL
jgi:glycosyltransferase involved in cell wall biosynthesis